jgi:hypothetical protein
MEVDIMEIRGKLSAAMYFGVRNKRGISSLNEEP